MHEQVSCPKNIFGKVTAYQTAILYGLCIVNSSFLVFFIDHYCAELSNKHCLLSIFSLLHIYKPLLREIATTF